jgi:hypothetical protein
VSAVVNPGIRPASRTNDNTTIRDSLTTEIDFDTRVKVSPKKHKKPTMPRRWLSIIPAS